MPAHKLDLGPADAHVDGAGAGAGPVRRVRRSPACARCRSAKGWSSDEARNCTACGAPFFESPQDQRPRLPTGVSPPASTENPGTWVSTTDRGTPVAKAKTVTAISAGKRKSLQPSQFALPARKAYPIDTPARVRNAATRLEQAKRAKTVTPAEYTTARAAIARAAHRFGIQSQYNATKDAPRARGRVAAAGAPSGVRVTVQTHPSGHRRIEVMHAADGDRAVFGDKPVAIDATALAETVRRLADVEAKLGALSADSADRSQLEGEVAKLRDELAEPRWNQVAKVGQFRGHPAGPFELTPPIFDQILRNYSEVDLGQVSIDFEHASEADESSGTIPVTGAPAQGRILRLENRGAEGLWGLCKFFEPALTYVREGKYPFFSPAIRFGAKHPETAQPIGARLTSVALVTRPFLRGLQPLAARDPSAPGATTTTMSLPTTHHEMMKSLKACMKLSDLATHEDMKAGLEKLREHAKGILDKPVVHASGHYSAGGVHCGDYLPQLAEAINAPAHMPIAEILDAVEDMIDAAVERHETEMHTMSDLAPTNDDPAVALGQTQEKLRAKDGQLQAAIADKSRLELQLRDAQASIGQLQTTTTTLETDLKTLRDAEAKRAEDAVKADVDTAFATYKDVKKLSDADRTAMTIVRRTDPVTFATLYPAVAPSQQHLLRNFTGDRSPSGSTAGATRMGDRPPPVTAPGAGPGGTGGAGLSPVDQLRLCDKLVSEHKMSREAATSFSYQVATGQRAMPTFG